MLTSRLKILPADKSFRKIKTKDYRYYEFPTLNDLKRAIRETEFELESAKQKNDLGIVREVKNYLGELWAMEKNWERKVGVKDKYDVNPDLINMYKQKFEEAIESGDKEEMKRWFREIMNHVSFTDAEDESGYDIRNIEKETTANDYFRKVIVTGKNLQLVLMSLLPNEDIGMEVHEDVDQFFRIDEGDGFCEIEGKGKTPIKDGSSIVIKAGTYHNIIAGDKGLKLYTIYAPPNHPPDRVQKTKAEAVAEEKQ